MLIKSLIISAAVSGLSAGAALAQQTPDKHVDMPIDAQTGKAVRDAFATPPSPASLGQVNHDDSLAAPAPAAGDAAVEVSATELSVFNKPETPYVTDSVSGPTAVENLVITNGPVADTPENRLKYRPLSAAGRRTLARGN